MKKYLWFLTAALLLLVACNQVDNGTSSFPKVKKPYSVESAAQNGDVVNVHGKFSNYEKWTTFLQNIEVNQPDQVRITEYSIEGDPILFELKYDGEQIEYMFDNSMDAFGSDLGKPITTCQEIEKRKLEQGREGYVLKGCENKKTGDTFWFQGEQ
ncbi:MAG: DUF4362 domain-containing protein [Paenibacillus sp.]|nr:DUF4362 domain-containing protein [Paenibacillus sp.]